MSTIFLTQTNLTRGKKLNPKSTTRLVQKQNHQTKPIKQSPTSIHNCKIFFFLHKKKNLNQHDQTLAKRKTTKHLTPFSQSLQFCFFSLAKRFN